MLALIGALVLATAVADAWPTTGSGLCAAPAPVPPTGGRVEGHIRWEDHSTRSNVEVRATTRSRKTYTTKTDTTGGYALTVADDVFLEFSDAREHVGAACFVRIPPSSRIAVVDVTLAHPRSDTPTDVGCEIPSELGAQKSTWSGARPIFLDDEEAKKLFASTDSSSPPDVALNLALTDIEDVVMTSDGAVARLTATGATTLAESLNANLGKTVVITVDGVRATRFAVKAEFPVKHEPVPLVIESSQLNGDERRQLCALLRKVEKH
jgi:hypothetical protein